MDVIADPIEPSDAHLASIRDLVIDVPTLQQKGYVVYGLSSVDIDKKRRCVDCRKVVTKADVQKAINAKRLAPVTAPNSTPELNYSDSKAGEEGGANKKKEAPKRCLFHSGRVYNRSWTCCQKQPMAPGCCGRDKHVPREYRPGELESNWLYHHTPSPRVGSASLISPVVAIDCEMGTAESGESELIRLSLIDFYSGRILLDKLVLPDCRMAHFNTRYSGVSRAMMNEARKNRSCIFGRAKARQEVWRFVGPETIVVGHGATGDLASLRWIHHKIIDTLVLEQNWVYRQNLLEENERTEKKLQEAKEALERGEALAEEGEEEDEEEEELNEDEAKKKKQQRQPKQPMSLKALTKERLDRAIQIAGRGHDSVEDAIATRDLLQWYILNRTHPAPAVYMQGGKVTSLG